MSDHTGALPIYTVGHSTRSIEEFVEILRLGSVQRVVDVRSIPRSRTNPQYNFDVLPDTLSRWQIGYTLVPELGGRRSRQKVVASGLNDYWQNTSFRNYADYAMSDAFRAGLQHLLALSSETTCAIMCSEAVWWRCHRRFIADNLLALGLPVLHLMSAKRVEPAKPTPAATRAGSVLIYPAEAIAAEAATRN